MGNKYSWNQLKEMAFTHAVTFEEEPEKISDLGVATEVISVLEEIQSLIDGPQLSVLIAASGRLLLRGIDEAAVDVGAVQAAFKSTSNERGV